MLFLSRSKKLSITSRGKSYTTEDTYTSLKRSRPCRIHAKPVGTFEPVPSAQQHVTNQAATIYAETLPSGFISYGNFKQRNTTTSFMTAFQWATTPTISGELTVPQQSRSPYGIVSAAAGTTDNSPKHLQVPDALTRVKAFSARTLFQHRRKRTPPPTKRRESPGKHVKYIGTDKRC